VQCIIHHIWTLRPTPKIKLRCMFFFLSVKDKRPCSERLEGWPLLIVETEANGDSRSTNERGLSLGLSCKYKHLLSCLGYSGRPSTKYFFPSRTLISVHLSPSHSKLGRQSCRVACILMCVSGPAKGGKQTVLHIL
jgi:hypothetical protein